MTWDIFFVWTGPDVISFLLTGSQRWLGGKCCYWGRDSLLCLGFLLGKGTWSTWQRCSGSLSEVTTPVWLLPHAAPLQANGPLVILAAEIPRLSVSTVIVSDPSSFDCFEIRVVLRSVSHAWLTPLALVGFLTWLCHDFLTLTALLTHRLKSDPSTRLSRPSVYSYILLLFLSSNRVNELVYLLWQVIDLFFTFIGALSKALY